MLRDKYQDVPGVGLDPTLDREFVDSSYTLCSWLIDVQRRMFIWLLAKSYICERALVFKQYAVRISMSQVPKLVGNLPEFCGFFHL